MIGKRIITVRSECGASLDLSSPPAICPTARRTRSKKTAAPPLKKRRRMEPEGLVGDPYSWITTVFLSLDLVTIVTSD